MNGVEVLRIVDAIHRDKGIDSEIIFDGIEQAILAAARKHYGEDEDIKVTIDRDTGELQATLNDELIEPDELGRIAAQTAKQGMIQKIREAQRDAQFEEFDQMRSHLVNGSVTRVDHGIATVNLGNEVEALLPRSEQIPGESHRVGERVRCVIIDVRKAGSRVKIILSRSHPDLVRRLFEIEIPEVSERIIEVRSLAREAGYRSKCAVTCYDNSIDAVGACVGVRGSRIKNIVEELAGERIDIVRWNDSLQVLIPNAMQPAEVEDVILCPMLGRVIVLVRDDQLSLAIGKKGQNVRLASKLVGWDIEVMTREELDEQLDRSVGAFSQVPHITEELAEALVSQGFFSFEDLSVIEPDQLLELSGLTEAQCDEIVAVADVESEREEREQDELRKIKSAQRQADREAAELAEQAGITPEQLDAMTGGEAGAKPKDDATADDTTKAEPEVESADSAESDAENASEAPTEGEASTEGEAPTEDNAPSSEAAEVDAVSAEAEADGVEVEADGDDAGSAEVDGEAAVTDPEASAAEAGDSVEAGVSSTGVSSTGVSSTGVSSTGELEKEELEKTEG